MKTVFFTITALLFSLNASAATMQVSYPHLASVQYSYYGTNGSWNHVSGSATEFDIKLNGITLSGVDWNDFFTTAYCVDLEHTINATTYSNVTLSPLTSGSSYLQAAWLMDRWGADASGNAQKEAGLQLAIWDSVYGDGFNNLTGGQIGSYYSSYFQSLPGDDLWTSLRNHYAIAYTYDSQGGKKQDLLVQLNPVPEPGTLLLVGMGIAGLGVAGRKRLKSKKA
jgi:hypothetical protein